MLPARRLKAAVLIALFALAWFGNIQHRDLFQTDEGRYAEIPREMVASGDWITPRLDGFKYFEKPILQYWATAVVYEAFGDHHWTARLWTALTGFLSILLVGFAGARLFGERAGWLGAAALAGSVYYIIMGHFNALDMGLAFFMALNLFGFLLAQQAAPGSREEHGWMLASWAAAALAVLTKGLIGIVLPGGVLVVYTLLTRDWAVWKRLRLVTGTLVFLLVSVPWFVAVSRHNPQFLHFFFIHEHFERYLTRIHHRYGPWWYFFPILLLGVLPWVWQSLLALREGIRMPERATDRLDSAYFLWLWVVVIFVFFMPSDSKLPSYILPIFPALALLMGREISRRDGHGVSWAAVITGGLAVIGLIFSPRIAHQGHGAAEMALYARLVPWAVGSLVLMLVAALAAFIAVRRRHAVAAAFVLCGGWFLATQCVTTGAAVLDPIYSTHSLVQQLSAIPPSDIPFYSVREYEQSLPFYLKRKVTVVAYQGELAFGMAQAPDHWIHDMPTFEQRWRQGGRAYAMMSRQEFENLAQAGLPMRVVARDPRRVIVERP